MRLARYWSSPPLIRGSARALKRRTEGRQNRAGLSSYALREKVRLGFRQCWPSRLSRLDVCEGTRITISARTCTVSMDVLSYLSVQCGPQAHPTVHCLLKYRPRRLLKCTVWAPDRALGLSEQCALSLIVTREGTLSVSISVLP